MVSFRVDDQLQMTQLMLFGILSVIINPCGAQLKHSFVVFKRLLDSEFNAHRNPEECLCMGSLKRFIDIAIQP